MEPKDSNGTGSPFHASRQTGTMLLREMFSKILLLVLLVWLLHQLVSVILLFVFAVTVVMALNPMVTWMEKKKVPRVMGTILVLSLVLVLLALLGWLILPRISEEIVNLAQTLPQSLEGLADRISKHFDIQGLMRPEAGAAKTILRSAISAVSHLWGYTFSLLTGVIFLLVVWSFVFYALIDPRPLLRVYLQMFRRDRVAAAARAYNRGSRMVSGWIWSNFIVGSVEAALVFLVLHLLEIPAALVWSALALFAEMVPKVGLYLMAIPPVLVAFSLDPTKGLWVIAFYWGMNEILGNFLMPRVRQATMDIHPVFVISMTVVMAYVFGLPGALVATPVSGFLQAFYEEFYLPGRHPDEEQIRSHVEEMLKGGRRDDS